MHPLKQLEHDLHQIHLLPSNTPFPILPLEQSSTTNSPIACYTENNLPITLSLRYCNLTILPESLSQLPTLQHLDLTGNSLTELPISLSQLTQLKTLSLDHNSLISLPTSLSQLTQLSDLH